MPELDSEAIDFRAASELFAPVRKLKRADLETLRLVTKHQWRKVAARAVHHGGPLGIDVGRGCRGMVMLSASKC